MNLLPRRSLSVSAAAFISTKGGFFMANNDNLDPKDLNKAPAEEIDTSTDVEAVMKKYDRESNVRRWEGKPGLVVKSLSALFSLYCIYVTLFSTAMPEIRLNIFLALILILGYLHYPIHKGVTRANYIPFYDIIIMVAGAFPFFYFAAKLRLFCDTDKRKTKEFALHA